MSTDRQMLLEAAGPLRALLEAPGIIEIMANPSGDVFVTRFGHGIAHADMILPSAIRERFLRVLAASVGAELHREAPTLHAALPDLGIRCQGVIPPASAAPAFTIRRHAHGVIPLERYEADGILTPHQRQVLEHAVRQGETLVIAGAVASGKTTLANALLHAMRDLPLRVVLLQDDLELQCAIPNTLALQTVDGRLTMRDLVKDSLRHAPDRIIIGEVRDGAALDFLKAAQTGHPGLVTLHCDSALDALYRLEQLVLEVSTDPQRALIGRVVKLVCFLEKYGRSWRCQEVLRVHGVQEGGYHTEPVALHQTITTETGG
jgi:type IV secretion system protein VirB11